MEPLFERAPRSVPSRPSPLRRAAADRPRSSNEAGFAEYTSRPVEKPMHLRRLKTIEIIEPDDDEMRQRRA